MNELRLASRPLIELTLNSYQAAKKIHSLRYTLATNQKDKDHHNKAITDLDQLIEHTREILKNL